jgi:two-component system LytT family sensor kinase
MPPHNVAALVHMVGFLTGAALYGMLFALVLRRRIDDRLPLLTAVLGLTWNLIGLAAYGIRDFAGHEPHPFLIATAYSALGFLPAVVVHSVLRSQTDPRHRRAAATFVILAYSVSTVAETLMFWAARFGSVPSAAALRMLTWSYAVLTVAIIIITRQRRAWSIVALAVFAVSALHLSHSESPHESWLVELVGHHASIPLIFAILYQDFRFALADVFLKRALALFALVAIASGLYLGVQVPLLEQHDFRSDPIAVGASVVLWTTMALLYGPLRRGATWIVDHIVLRRADYAQLREDIARRIADVEDPEAVMGVLAEALRAPLAADEIKIARDGEGVTIPTTDEPRYAMDVGALAGGRRLMSDDLDMLDGVALLAARRIDALRVARERQEMTKLTTQAELRALRAQVNPHFLFNALNTIGFLIQTAPKRAHATLMKLTSLLRGVLRTGEAAVHLGDEIDLVGAYLEIERARFEERLQVTIDVPEPLRHVRVPPLILQPLVENAIKHGIANSRGGGQVHIHARLEEGQLLITVRNTGLPTSEIEIAHGRRRGVGLANLDARLRHLYGDSARLMLVATPSETCAELALPAVVWDAA